MKNKIRLGLIALSVVAILSVSFVAAFIGHEGTYSKLSEVDEEMWQFKIAIQEAIENEDFEGWRTLMESQLTQEKFNELVEKQSQFSEEMMQNWEDKDWETIKQLKGEMHGEYNGELEGHGEYFQDQEDFHKKRGFFHMFQFWKR